MAIKDDGTGGTSKSVAHQHPVSSSRPTSGAPENHEENYLKSPGHSNLGEQPMQSTGIAPSSSASLENDIEDNVDRWANFLRGYTSDKTILNYRHRIIRLGKIMGKDPIEWEPADCTALQSTDEWRGWTDATRKFSKASLKNYWIFHRRRDLLEGDNLGFWKRPRTAGGLAKYKMLKKKTASPEDVDLVKSRCREEILTSKSQFDIFRHFIIYLIAEFGIRIKAIQYTRMCDFHLEEGYYHIFRTKGNNSRNIHIEHSITDLFDAFTAARSLLIEKLINNYKDKPDVVARLESLKQPDAWAFFQRYQYRDVNSDGRPSNVGEQLTDRAVYSIVKNGTRGILNRKDDKGKVVHINPHAFRHAKVFELLETRNMDPTGVKNFMGHEAIQTTFDYCPQGLEEQKAAFERASNGNGNGGQGKITPRSQTDVEEKARTLKELYDKGILDAEAFGKAVAALL